MPTDIGNTIADARAARRWSQDNLASEATICRAVVYRLEKYDGEKSGPVRVRADTLFRIAHAFDMEITELVPDWPEWSPVNNNGHGQATRERRREIGMTLAELAQEVGKSESTMSRFERGQINSPKFVKMVGGDLVASEDDTLAHTLKLKDSNAFERLVRPRFASDGSIIPT